VPRPGLGQESRQLDRSVTALTRAKRPGGQTLQRGFHLLEAGALDPAQRPIALLLGHVAGEVGRISTGRALVALRLAQRALQDLLQLPQDLRPDRGPHRSPLPLARDRTIRPPIRRPPGRGR
jgi:hypothetical protein